MATSARAIHTDADQYGVAGPNCVYSQPLQIGPSMSASDWIDWPPPCTAPCACGPAARESRLPSAGSPAAAAAP